MATTSNLDGDVIAAIRRHAKLRIRGLEKAFSRLLGRDLSARPKTSIVNGLHVFDVRPGSPPITSERVKELDAEYH